MQDYDPDERRMMGPPTQRMPQSPPQMSPLQAPTQRRARKWFRWEYLAIPATIALFAWFMNVAKDPPITWNDLLYQWGIIDRTRFTRLAILCVGLIAITAVWRILRGGSRGE